MINRESGAGRQAKSMFDVDSAGTSGLNLVDGKTLAQGNSSRFEMRTETNQTYAISIDVKRAKMR